MPKERLFQPPSAPHECAVYGSAIVQGKADIRLEDDEHLGMGNGLPMDAEEARKLAAALIECADYLEARS